MEQPIPIGSSLLSRIKHKTVLDADDKRRKLSYFGHADDGQSTLRIKYLKIPTFIYQTEMPLDQRLGLTSADAGKPFVDRTLRVRGDHVLDRFLVVPERKNVWMGGIRSQCEGVLSAKTYNSAEEDKGVYTVIPEIPGSKVTVDEVYRMWLALENAMMRRESLIIVEDPALAQVTKFRTEQWRFLDNLVSLGSFLAILNSIYFGQYPSLFIFPLSLVVYGHTMLTIMSKKDPASKYKECQVNKNYEVDPDSYVVCDAQISMRYLRSPKYRMFKLEGHQARDKKNQLYLGISFASCCIAVIRNIYSLPLRHEVIKRGFEDTLPVPTNTPLNIFEQIRNRFFTFGQRLGPGRSDVVHWLVQNFLLYYLVFRHIPWAVQSVLEYLEREYIMETSIRYLQFRNLQGDERYEFPARNLYRTMQKDYPNNRILNEMYDHYHCPPEGYYNSSEFLNSREPHQVTLEEVIRRCKISYFRNW